MLFTNSLHRRLRTRRQQLWATRPVAQKAAWVKWFSALRLTSANKPLQQTINQLQEQLEQMQQQRITNSTRPSPELFDIKRSLDQQLRTVMDGAASNREQTLVNCSRLAESINNLLGLIKTFERWHADINVLPDAQPPDARTTQ